MTKKVSLYGINLLINVTYMQNLRFLHWTVWRTACGQTWKNGIWHFLRAKRPIFKLRNITLNGINPQTNVTYMQNLRFLHWMVWRTACRQTWKNGLLACFCARSAQFLNYKKISLYGINPHTNVTYMQNLRFLHWTVWRTACRQTGVNAFWHVFWVRSAHF